MLANRGYRVGLMKGTAVLMLAGAGLSACGGVPDEPETQLLVRSPIFSGPAAMAIESDLVVMGTVSGVDEGRSVGEGAEQIRYRDVTIDVEKVFLSRVESSPTQVVVQEIGWANGKAVENHEMPWSVAGQRGYFFLQKDVPGKFGFLGPQARIWIEAGKLHSGGDHDLRAVDRLDALTPDKFAVEVAEATGRVSSQRLENPEGPAVGDGDLK
jgi:hypothetical protein